MLTFEGQLPRPNLNLQASMHVSVTVQSHLQRSEASWNQMRRLAVLTKDNMEILLYTGISL